MSDENGNFTMIPNWLLNQFLPLLTHPELLILLYAYRRIEGFHRDNERLSYRQLMEGVPGQDAGTGLCIDATSRAIRNLTELGLLIVVGRHPNLGTTYRLPKSQPNGCLKKLQLRDFLSRSTRHGKTASATSRSTNRSTPSHGEAFAAPSHGELTDSEHSVPRSSSTPSHGVPALRPTERPHARAIIRIVRKERSKKGKEIPTPPGSVSLPSVAHAADHPPALTDLPKSGPPPPPPSFSAGSGGPSPAGAKQAGEPPATTIPSKLPAKSKKKQADEDPTLTDARNALRDRLFALWGHGLADLPKGTVIQENSGLKSLAALGITPDQLEAFYRAEKRTPFWAAKRLGACVAAKNIQPWLQVNPHWSDYLNVPIPGEPGFMPLVKLNGKHPDTRTPQETYQANLEAYYASKRNEEQDD